MVEMRKDVSAEQVCFRGVRIAGQDKGLDSLSLIGAELCEHLIGIADDSGAAARTGSADARPKMIFDKAFSACRSAQLSLPLHADTP